MQEEVIAAMHTHNVALVQERNAVTRQLEQVRDVTAKAAHCISWRKSQITLQTTASPLHRFTASPLHRFTASPLHRFTASPLSHECTPTPPHDVSSIGT
jgi:hypothetical protein